MDFITEMAGSIGKLDVSSRANSLQYLGPWMKNLPLFTDPCSKFYEPSGTRFRDCIRMLVDLTTAEDELSSFVHKYIWTEISKLETNTINIILDELMRAAVDGGMGSARCERVAETMNAVSSINVRGRLLARVRKVRTCSICSVMVHLEQCAVGYWQDIHKADKEPRGQRPLERNRVSRPPYLGRWQLGEEQRPEPALCP